MSTLVELVTGETAAVWSALGFTIDGDGVIHLGSGGSGATRLRCRGDDGGPNRWMLAAPDPGDSDAGPADLDGLATTWVRHVPPPTTAEHPNTVTGLDHVVVRSPNLDRTTDALVAVGADLRRIRPVPIGDEPMEQRFFRLGGPIIELVGPATAAVDAASQPATIWGYAFVAADIDVATRLLGDACAPPKDAVQRGRRIATVRTRDLGISPTVAFMTPHP